MRKPSLELYKSIASSLKNTQTYTDMYTNKHKCENVLELSSQRLETYSRLFLYQTGRDPEALRGSDGRKE